MSPEFAIIHGMDEIGPELGILNKRLGFGFGPEQLAQIISLVWFPGSNGSYLARVNGSLRNKDGEFQRYLFSKNGGHAPWIPSETLETVKGSEPVIFTESFLKGLAVLHAGGLPIAFVGPWISEPVGESEDGKSNNRVLATELSRFNFRGRSVYLAFDQDQTTNRNVRNAVIRAWILLTVQGAKVYQLSWSGPKGIDDYLAATTGTNRVKQKEVLGNLTRAAKLFEDKLRFSG